MKFLRQLSLSVIAFCLSFAALAQPAIAAEQAAQHTLGLVSTGEMASLEAGAIDANHVRSQLKAMISRQEAVEQMKKHGVTAEAALARIDALTDQEAIAMAENISSAPAGASDVLGILFTVFIILLITDILGLTKIFPFTRSIR